jgi:hypothetical protein
MRKMRHKCKILVNKSEKKTGFGSYGYKYESNKMVLRISWARNKSSFSLKTVDLLWFIAF